MNHKMENIERVLYINLTRRADRREEMQRELQRVGIPMSKVIRVCAVDLPEYPTVGCNLSHAQTLRLAHQLGVENVLILEDDFDFIEDLSIVNKCVERLFSEQFRDQWDVVHFAAGQAELLGRWPEGSTVDTVSPFLIPIKDENNASAYLIKRPVISGLAQTIEMATPLLQQTGAHWLYQNDVVWKEHQQRERWFRFPTALGAQRLTYSDLAQRIIQRVHILSESSP